MHPRLIDVFFYGLFMDVDVLLGKGVHAESPRRATIRGYALRIGQRATLIADGTGRAYGMVVALSHTDIEQLYAEESLRAYKPEAVLCELDDGSRIPTLCFNLVEAPAESERNPAYAAKLSELALRLQLPQDYVSEISALG